MVARCLGWLDLVRMVGSKDSEEVRPELRKGERITRLQVETLTVLDADQLINETLVRQLSQ